MATDFQSRMLLEFKNKTPLDAAREHAFTFIDEVFDRRAYPGAAELGNLEQFVEPLSEEGTDGRAILDQLNRYGSPATISSLGGRYFGLVVGGALPAALGARWLADVWNQNTALYRLSPAS